VTPSLIDLGFDPSQPRDKSGKWSKIAGAIERAAKGRGGGGGADLESFPENIWATPARPPKPVPGTGEVRKLRGEVGSLRPYSQNYPRSALGREIRHLREERAPAPQAPTRFAPDRTTWQTMAEFGPREKAAQQASGIWGPGRSYADHTAALARLSPAQRRLYTQHVIGGKSPYQALKLAQGGGGGGSADIGAMLIGQQNFSRSTGMETIYDLARVHPSETAGGRKSALKRGLAIAPPSPGAAPGFPITDASHWEKARRAIGRVKSPARRAAVARLLRKTAGKFGKTAALHQSWAAPGGKKMSNDEGAIEMARRLPVMDPADIVVARGSGGQAVIRHRRGGGLIGVITHTDDGWVSEPDGGRVGTSHTHQRGALVELLGLYNRSTGTAQAAPQPLQPPPVQTPLMRQFNVPAIRLATPANGGSDSGRTATSDGDKNGNGNGDLAGLTPKGITIYRKLRQKMPADRALAFARRAQSFGGAKAS